MFETNVSLKQLSHYKIGGNAKYFFEAKNVNGLIKAVEKQRWLKTPLFVLAGATNVLINDGGFDGLIIKIPNSKFRIQNDNSKFKIIKAGAGTPMAELVETAVEENLSGLEWAAGLPGTLGGAVRGNAGAFGGEIKDIVREVVSLDISQKNPKIVKRNGSDCQFGYRSSVFKKNPRKEIIIETTLRLKRDDKKSIKEKTAKNINYRLLNHPMEYPSLGSTFKNVPISQVKKSAVLKGFPVKNDPLPVIPAAFLISEAGLKGIVCGGAMISPKHPNFIVNVLDAKAEDVENLIKLVKSEVKKKFKIELQEEIERLNNRI
jgi:UDP-N-acetylmuramate dehydrogenase